MKTICHPIYMKQNATCHSPNTPKSTIPPKERYAHPPRIEVFIVLNGKDAEKGQGKGEMGEGSDTLFFFG